MIAGLTIDYSISIGTIIQVLLIIGGGVFAIVTMKQTVLDLKHTVKEMERDIKDLSKAMLQIAIQDVQIKVIQEDIREMKHLRGFVVDPPVGGSKA